MDARKALTDLTAALFEEDIGALPPQVRTALHDARNVLAVPEPPLLEPKDFQRGLCLLLKSRADAQNLPAKGAKRERAYIEGLMGAAMALQVLGSDQLNPFLILATLGTIRGAVEAVNAIAEGEELP